MSINAHVAFQPIVCSTSGAYRAYEVLTRFLNSQGHFVGPNGYVMPGEWADLDLWILDSLAEWCSNGNQLSRPLYINISTETMTDDNAFERWLARFVASHISLNAPVVLELNEQVSGDDVEKRWEPLAKLNIGLALDDFGTDNASLERLRSFPWTVCKFESHCLGVGQSPAGLRYALESDITTIVERVETDLDARNAQAAGITLHQGYFYASPQVVALEYAIQPPSLLLAEATQ